MSCICLHWVHKYKTSCLRERSVSRFTKYPIVLPPFAEVGADEVIPIPNVNGKILAKVIEFCDYHVKAGGEGKSDDEVKAWDAEFTKVDQGTLFELILAANYLNIKTLLDLTCQTVANMIKGKTPEEIRKTFGIVNDFTPEEEEEVRRENQWAFE